jgi:hypothetical protein
LAKKLCFKSTYFNYFDDISGQFGKIISLWFNLKSEQLHIPIGRISTKL